MAITATQVKELRERTGCGMMECKKALVETTGDIDAAIALMRKNGQAKAEKKASRTAAEGLIVVERSTDGKCVTMLEVNCETDFVAKDESFQAFAGAVGKRILASNPDNVNTLNSMALTDNADTTIERARSDLIAKIGENVSIRRFVNSQTDAGIICNYIHGVKIGVVVELEGGDESLGKDLAMHIAASQPICISEAEVPSELLEKERDIAMAQAQKSGKPENIIEKMVTGKLRKYAAEVTLLGQQFIKDPNITVAKLLQEKSAKVISFHRFQVGEGIEKRNENFAEEVMAQITT